MLASFARLQFLATNGIGKNSLLLSYSPGRIVCDGKSSGSRGLAPSPSRSITPPFSWLGPATKLRRGLKIVIHEIISQSGIPKNVVHLAIEKWGGRAPDLIRNDPFRPRTQASLNLASVSRSVR